MKKLPIGKQEFRQLIEGDFAYVDKTEYLTQIAVSSVPVFLSRPRRFGKSLIISTFEELFSGNKELFNNTFAYHNWDFTQTNLVLRLDLSTVFGEDKKELNKALLRLIHKSALIHSVNIKEDVDAYAALDELIFTLYRKSQQIVILIDEYDAPILDNLKNENLEEIKKILRAFYKIIKANEKYIRFVFITGISKFSQVGIFSAMNNLDDISLTEDFATITGYTENEIRSIFPEHIQEVKEKLNLDDTVFWEQLAQYYNGYSWDGEHFVYNPFSVLNFLKKKSFYPYWMSTGSPSFIVEYAKGVQLELSELEGIRVYKTFMEKTDIDQSTPESFLTQAGYLTIKKQIDHKYILGFPNYEVRRSFCDLLITSRYKVNDNDILGVEENLIQALKNEDAEGMISQFKIIYSSIPYVHFDSNKNEHFYSSILLMFLQAAGFNASAERLGNKGRLDLSIQYDNCIYIIELKSDKPKVAIQQIHEKNYGGKYKNRNIINIGLQIDFEERNIVDFLVEDENDLT